jgi:hypothetical protein
MKLAKLAKKHDDRAELNRAVKKQLTEKNYMSGGDDSWSLSEIVSGIDTPSQLALCALSGVRHDGAAIEDKPCEDMRYKLRVITRQACFQDKDGQKINGWDVLPSDGSEAGGESIRPLWDEEPCEGDLVRVKGNMLDEDPDSGLPMGYIVKRNMVLRGKDIYRYKVYKVDKNLCITVPLDQAAQLLQQKGVEIAFPKRKRKNKIQTAQDKERYTGQRVITNWHFKEVSHNFRISKPRQVDAGNTEV